MTDIGTVYDSPVLSPKLGLGRAEVDFTDVTRLKFTVYVNKSGTGTQSWQLWDETNGVEILVIDDAGAVGIRVLSTETTDPFVIPTGLVTVRVRIKSTVSTDDPTYFGASLRLE